MLAAAGPSPRAQGGGGPGRGTAPSSSHPPQPRPSPGRTPVTLSHAQPQPHTPTKSRVRAPPRWDDTSSEDEQAEAVPAPMATEEKTHLTHRQQHPADEPIEEAPQVGHEHSSARHFHRHEPDATTPSRDALFDGGPPSRSVLHTPQPLSPAHHGGNAAPCHAPIKPVRREYTLPSRLPTSSAFVGVSHMAGGNLDLAAFRPPKPRVETQPTVHQSRSKLHHRQPPNERDMGGRQGHRGHRQSSSLEKDNRHRERSSHKRKHAHSLSPSARPSKRAEREVTASVVAPARQRALPAPARAPISSQLQRIRQASSKMEVYLMALLTHKPDIPLERQMEDALGDEEEYDTRIEYKQIKLTPIKALSVGMSCVSPHVRECLTATVSTLRGFSLLPSSDIGCSHLLLEKPNRTLKLLYAIARGSWVLTPAWLLASLERRRWLNEELFESHTFVGCRMSRVNREQDGPTLFRGLHVLVTPGTTPARDVLEELLYLSGANIVLQPSDASIVLSASASDWAAFNQQLAEGGAGSRQRGALNATDEADKPHEPSVDRAVVVAPTWLYDSLTHFMIMPPAAYLLLDQPPTPAVITSPQL